MIDPSLLSTSRGLWALKWSFAMMLLTALIQIVVFVFSRSVALLADTIHNFADALTAVPLAIAFLLTRRGASPRFTYGLGRTEDLAGLFIIVTILFSAVVAAIQAIQRLIHPEPMAYLGWVAFAAIVGFVGNEAVAIFRIRVGRQIGSAALIADGYHARIDALTSLAVLIGAIGVWLGYPLADPLVGLGISIAIFWIVWESTRTIIFRMLDGVDTDVLDAIRGAAEHVTEVEEVTDVRARWVGHRLQVDLNVTVAGDLTVHQGHVIAKEVRRQLLHHLPHLGDATIHVDPRGEGGEHHHRRADHQHANAPRGLKQEAAPGSRLDRIPSGRSRQ